MLKERNEKNNFMLARQLWRSIDVGRQTVLNRYTKTNTYANSVDRNEPSHQNLHYLLFGSRILSDTMDVSKFEEDRRVRCSNLRLEFRESEVSPA